ncbi:T9SS type A sorting domain-containing protein [Lewinella cohaerens]|uniref:T9SS type A sorting domain-containing protein n=1 Tax=Lewinella cohaerens TaxID=70995 RepID=UPI00037AF9DA|nr:T9SS type A sorting domain-containing protein [Lewinella cohaerens]
MKTRFTLFLLFVAMSFTNLFGQVSVLFVDDSADEFGNAEYFYAGLEAIDYDATYYNAVDSAAGPSDLYMNNFDLVIWHTSSDGAELLFWNGIEEDNASLKSYLNGGGNLWLVGNDFFFDRYGLAPVTFSAGEFAYDYMGVTSFDVESFNDDGEVGVPMMLPDANTVIPGLNDLTWQFPTLWYADGVSLVDDATPVYRMGDADYVLADSISAAYYDNGTSKVLTYFFDITLVTDFEMLTANLLPVMSFFEGVISDNENVLQSSLNANIFPNPTASELNLEVALENASEIAISVLNVYGQVIAELMPTQQREAGKNAFQFNLDPTIANGYYFVKIKVDNKLVLKPFVLQK